MKKKRILMVEIIVAIVFAAVTTGLIQHFSSAESVSPFTTVRVGVENYAPFISSNESGQMVGISASILGQITIDNKLQIAQVGPKTLPQLFKLLTEDKIDIITSLQRTPEREAFALFTKPYITVHSTLVSRAPNPKTVCIGKGFAIESWLRQHRADLKITTANADINCMEMMASAKVDSVALDDISLSAQQSPKEWVREPLKFSYSFSFAVAKSKPALLKILNASLPDDAAE